jgi:hypothetical protein
MTPSKQLRVWGITRLRDIQQCPRRFLAKYEWKQWIDDDENEAMKRGKRFHGSIEEAIKWGVVMPNEPMFNNVSDYVLMLCDMKAQGIGVLPEFKFGMNIAFQMTDFFKAPNLRVRCGVDVLVRDGGKILVIDWKTGRYKPEHLEDADFYGCMTDIALGAQDTTVQYVYADDPQCSFERHIDDAGGMARHFYHRFEEADAYLADKLDNPPMNPGKYCSYCGHVQCPENKNTKAKATAKAWENNSNLLFKG